MSLLRRKKIKNIVITCDNDGLGKTLATFLSGGNNVIILATNGDKLKEVARLINFIIDTPSDVMIPEVGIKNINN